MTSVQAAAQTVLGTLTFGNQTADESAARMLEIFVEKGNARTLQEEKPFPGH
jgi:hypothetical protein